MNATKWGLLASVMTVVALSAGAVLAADAPTPPTPPKDAKADAPKTPQFANPNPGKCPVTDEDIDEKITAEYKGKTYAFCCNGCRKKFIANPDQYLPVAKKE